MTKTLEQIIKEIRPLIGVISTEEIKNIIQSEIDVREDETSILRQLLKQVKGGEEILSEEALPFLFSELTTLRAKMSDLEKEVRNKYLDEKYDADLWESSDKSDN